jgi:hypothetical protein
MGPELVALVDLALNAIEVATLVGVLWQCFHLRRDIGAILRVVRRMDRKMAAESVR